MLEVNDLYVGYYRDLNILQGVSLQAEEGNITTILGANGVGKSTMLKAVYGFLRPNQGQIMLNEEDIIEVPTYERINMGISYIPQQPGVFRFMSVEENLELGAWTFKNDKQRLKRKLDENYERFPALKTAPQIQRRRALRRYAAHGRNRAHAHDRSQTDPRR